MQKIPFLHESRPMMPNMFMPRTSLLQLIQNALHTSEISISAFRLPSPIIVAVYFEMLDHPRLLFPILNMNRRKHADTCALFDGANGMIILYTS